MREHRKAQGLSMHGLALKVGCTATSIYNWEVGDRLPSSANLSRVAKALGVAMDEVRLVERREKIEKRKATT